MRLRHSKALLLTAISVAGVVLASIWLFAVPFFQQPDENAHADYAFAIYDAGKVFQLHDANGATNVTSQVRYLEKSSDFFAIRYDASQKVPPAYGTPEYFRLIDKLAPQTSHRIPSAGSHLPYAVFGYPPGYYALAAAAMTLGDHLSGGSLSIAFLAGRGLGVLCLLASLLLTYLCFGEMHFKPKTRLLATAAVAVLPMTSWVSGYLQPDNLTFTLVTCCLLAALRWRKTPLAVTESCFVGLSLAALAAVKPLYAFAVFIPVAAMIIAITLQSSVALLRRIWTTTLALAVPACAIGMSRYFTLATRIKIPKSLGWHAAFRTDSSVTGNVASLAHYAYLAIIDAFVTGPSFRGFWDSFGWNGTPFLPSQSGAIVDAVLSVASVQLLLLMLVREALVLRSIASIASRGHLLRAVRLLSRDVVLNSYFVWTALLLCVFAVSRGTFAIQGRYWLPVLPASIAIAVLYVPRLLKPRYRARAALIAASAWFGYGAVIAPFAIASVYRTFYTPQPGTTAQSSITAVTAIRDSTNHAFDSLNVVTRRGEVLTIDGWARPIHDSTIRSVIAVIDGSRKASGRYGLDRLALALALNDDAVRRAGFTIALRTGFLERGDHIVDLYVQYARRAPDRWKHHIRLTIT